MQNKLLEELQRQEQIKQTLKLEKENLKRLDFNRFEYEYFIENCNFTDRQKEILDLRRKGNSIIEITFKTHLSESTIFRELKRIKKKIYKFI